jgi:hypothetical protein
MSENLFMEPVAITVLTPPEPDEPDDVEYDDTGVEDRLDNLLLLVKEQGQQIEKLTDAVNTLGQMIQFITSAVEGMGNMVREQGIMGLMGKMMGGKNNG